MPLKEPDQRRVRSAHGYIELGMCEEANAQLEEIDPFCRSAPEVLTARVAIYQGLKKWDLMAIVAGKLVEWDPQTAGHFANLAYATRRAESIDKAREILRRGAELHPADGRIRFNLACYEAQLGDLDRAKEYLKAAIEIDPRFKMLALDDSDLEPLWNSLGDPI